MSWIGHAEELRREGRLVRRVCEGARDAVHARSRLEFRAGAGCRCRRRRLKIWIVAPLGGGREESRHVSRAAVMYTVGRQNRRYEQSLDLWATGTVGRVPGRPLQFRRRKGPRRSAGRLARGQFERTNDSMSRLGLEEAPVALRSLAVRLTRVQLATVLSRSAVASACHRLVSLR